MALIQVYTKCIKTRYKVRVLSKGTLIFVIASVFSIILPFILAYKSKGFWMKRDIFYEFPDMRFQGKYIFIAYTSDKSLPIVCSSYPLLMEYFHNFSSCSQIKVREIDYDDDKLVDELFIGLKINLPANSEILSFTLIIPLHLKLHTPFCPLEMESELILQRQMMGKYSDLTLLGTLKVEQSSPLLCSSKMINTAFNYSAISDESNVKNFKIESIFYNQKSKNLTTTIPDILTIQESKNKNHLLLNVKVNYQEQQFYYNPHFLQIMKWAWIQYYVIYIIIQFIVNKIMNYLFDNRLVLYYEEKPNKNN